MVDKRNSHCYKPVALRLKDSGSHGWGLSVIQSFGAVRKLKAGENGIICSGCCRDIEDSTQTNVGEFLFVQAIQ